VRELLKKIDKMSKRMEELETAALPLGGIAKAPPYTHFVKGFEVIAQVIQPGEDGYQEVRDADGNLVPFMETGHHRP
jgi:hypothetical protein